MSKLIIFSDPLEAKGTLTLDNGTVVHGIPDFHSTGRPGQSFTIPLGSPNGHGALLVLKAEDKVDIKQRGLLSMSGEIASFAVDDFYMEDT